MRDGYLPRVNFRLTVVLRELPICGGCDMRISIQRPRLAEAIEPPFNFALNRPVCWRDKRLILMRLRGMSQMCHFRTHAPQQSAAIRSPCGHWRATRATPLSEGPQ
jgi:hypothetical protein